MHNKFYNINRSQEKVEMKWNLNNHRYQWNTVLFQRSHTDIKYKKKLYELVTFFSFSYCAKWILGLKGLTQLRCLLGSCEVLLQCTFNSQGDVIIVCFTLLVNKYRHLRHQILISKKNCIEIWALRLNRRTILLWNQDLLYNQLIIHWLM